MDLQDTRLPAEQQLRPPAEPIAAPLARVTRRLRVSAIQRPVPVRPARWTHWSLAAVDASGVLNYGHKVLYRVLVGLDNPRPGAPGGCYASSEVLGDKIGAGRSQGAALAKELEQLGLLVCVPDGRNVRRFPTLPDGVLEDPAPTKDWGFARSHAWVMAAARRLDQRLSERGHRPGNPDNRGTVAPSGFPGTDRLGFPTDASTTVRVSRIEPSGSPGQSPERNDPQEAARSASLTAVPHNSASQARGSKAPIGSASQGAHTSLPILASSQLLGGEGSPQSEGMAEVVASMSALESEDERRVRIEATREKWRAWRRSV